MKQVAVGIAVAVLAVAGCASDPAKRGAVAEVEVARIAPTVKPLSEFRGYELRPILMSTGVSADGDKVAVSVICTGGGYFFGATLKNLLGDIKRYNMYIAVGVMAAGFLIWLIRDVRKRR